MLVDKDNINKKLKEFERRHPETRLIIAQDADGLVCITGSDARHSNGYWIDSECRWKALYQGVPYDIDNTNKCPPIIPILPGLPYADIILKTYPATSMYMIDDQ